MTLDTAPVAERIADKLFDALKSAFEPEGVRVEAYRTEPLPTSHRPGIVFMDGQDENPPGSQGVIEEMGVDTIVRQWTVHAFVAESDDVQARRMAGRMIAFAAKAVKAADIHSAGATDVTTSGEIIAPDDDAGVAGHYYGTVNFNVLYMTVEGDPFTAC